METVPRQKISLLKRGISGRERLAILRRAQKVLGKKAGAMLRELKKIRSEWR